MLQPHLYQARMSNFEESALKMMDDMDDLDDDPNEGHSDMDEWFPEDGSKIGIESPSLSLKFRFKNKPLGFT
jgi:hypothetical protein